MIQVNDGTPEFRVRAHIFESLSKNPPAASLFVTEPDWEIGNKGRWSIECCPTIRFGAIGNRLARRVRLRRA